MAEKNFQVLSAAKMNGVTAEEAQAALEVKYPNYNVEVYEKGDEFVAKLTKRLSNRTRQVLADDEDVPPFKDKDDDGDGDDDDKEEKKAPKEDSDKDDGDIAPKEPGAPHPPSDGKEEDGGSDLSKALHAVETLTSVLPKLKDQLKALCPVEDHNPLEEAEHVGPTPHPPGVAPGGPPVPPRGGPPGGRPPMSPGPRRPGPGAPMVGVPTFTNVKKERFVYRPIANEDGSEVTLAEATNEIQEHPKYTDYDLFEIKRDGNQIVAHLKLREE